MRKYIQTTQNLSDEEEQKTYDEDAIDIDETTI